MPLLDTRHKKKSFTLTTLLLSVLILLLFYIGLTYMDPPIENGITINFGTMEYGMGEEQPLEPVRPEQQEPEVVEESEPEPQSEPSESEPEQEAAQTEQPSEDLLTQEQEESVRIRQQQQEDRHKAEAAAERERKEAEDIAREKEAAELKARQEQEAKKKELDALMGGLNNAAGEAEGSEGDDSTPADKGNPEGNPYASTYYGSPGSGSGTDGYGLSGRSLMSKDAVRQECNEAGRVVVRIEVDRSGKVINANPGVRGTTNNHPCLLEPARKTAFMHRWNLDSNAPDRQVGFVVVNFKLGQ